LNILEWLQDEIQHRKNEAAGILQCSYSDKQIKDLCKRFHTVINSLKESDLDDLPEQLLAERHSPETFYAVSNLWSLMYLEKHVPSKPGCSLAVEEVANLVLTGKNAILSLVEAGWKPAEPLALTRIKQKRISRKSDIEITWKKIKYLT
jgi:hypothetical protein